MKNIYKIAILSFFIFIASSCENKKDDKKITQDNTPPIVVKTSSVSSDGSSSFVNASGKITSRNSSNLSTRMMGFVNKVYVKVGDRVRKGQLLVSINNADLQAKSAQVRAKITEAKAAYNSAEKDYNRFKSLFSDNSASQKEMDDMTAHFEMAKARLEASNQMKNEVNSQFAYTNIRAPFSGVVTSKSIEKGDMASPGVPLISVEVPGKFDVIAMVPESEISQIKLGSTVDITIKSLNKTIKGKVTEVSTSSKNTGGQFLVKVQLEKSDINVLSGMFATVQFPIHKNETVSNMVLLPNTSIVRKGQLSGVYTLSQSSTSILRWLRLGRVFGDKVEVLSGLSKGEIYIISSKDKLYNGAKVTVQ